MSTLGMQVEKLRELAVELGIEQPSAAMQVREAADTITSLWNSLTASEAALNKAAGNWARCDADLRENQGTRYSELFGTPKKAARTLADVIIRCDANQYAHCNDCPLFDVCEDGCNVLEWLRGDAE